MWNTVGGFLSKPVLLRVKIKCLGEKRLWDKHDVWRYLDALAETGRLESTAIQTVGVKMDDGVIISYVE